MDTERYISRFDEDFPDNLRFIPGCPAGIYVDGELPDPKRKTVAIVGSRACSEYGRNMAEYFSSHLASAGVQIVSGLAKGIDGIAQKAAIDAGGVSFGVLGFGVDIVYPKENADIFRLVKEHGGLISEHPSGTPPVRTHFASRNRIISGLCDLLLVIEARLKSGTSITVSNALEQGRDVFAIPGRLTDPLSAGCNKLISEGAGIARTPDDILRALGLKDEEAKVAIKKNSKGFIEVVKPQIIELDDKEKTVYECLDLYPKSLDEIVRQTRLSIPDLLEILLSLSVKGAAKECARNHYIRQI
ncbi:MAG: DNA-processing protein DprA [Lachnospiraceae bacterium]|nr:DNA-processing protein DprA [Lachnospiraceae bacterium]